MLKIGDQRRSQRTQPCEEASQGQGTQHTKVLFIHGHGGLVCVTRNQQLRCVTQLDDEEYLFYYRNASDFYAHFQDT